MDNNDALCWFAMRVTYRRELDVQKQLDAAGFGTFIPMHHELVEKGGRKKKLLVPVIHNLIFVRAAKPALQEFKQRLPHLQYMVRKIEGRTVPIVVPDREMDNFIRLVTSYDNRLEYIDTFGLKLEQGMKVRVTGGPFEGQEGVLVKLPGRRCRRIVVEIRGVMAVVMTSVPKEWIEVVEE